MQCLQCFNSPATPGRHLMSDIFFLTAVLCQEWILQIIIVKSRYFFSPNISLEKICIQINMLLISSQKRYAVDTSEKHLKEMLLLSTTTY